MASPIEYTNNTWDFRFSIQDSNGADVNLNGYKLRFTVKKKPDTDPEDDDPTNTIDSQDFDINTSITYKDVQVDKSKTDIAPWTYYAGFRYITPAWKSKNVESQITVKQSITNRTA